MQEMDKFRVTPPFISLLLLLGFIVLSPSTILHNTFGDDGSGQNLHVEQNKQDKPSFTEMLKHTISLLRRSHLDSLDKVKSVIHQVQLNFFPPNLDFRSADEAQARGGGGGGGDDEGDGAGGKMKDAAEKSFGTSKVAIEETAKSAAKVVGEVMQKTAEKVKDSISEDNESSKSEL